MEEHLADELISIGDYVLTGGELGAMVISDAVARYGARCPWGMRVARQAILSMNRFWNIPSTRNLWIIVAGKCLRYL